MSKIDGNVPKRFPNTKKDYVKYLNELGESLGDDEFIIAGIMRKRRDNYGQLIKDNDPTAFNLSYNEWKLNQK